MENIVFISTLLSCAIFAFITRHVNPKNTEKTRLQQTLDKISEIQECVQNLEVLFKLKQEHTARCILYRAVHVSQPIFGIEIQGCEAQFRDVYVVDYNENQVEFTINRNKNLKRGYRIRRDSIHTEDHTFIVIEFSFPVIFKYIEFTDLHTYNSENITALLLQDHKIGVTINENKHIICNTAFL